VKCSAAILFLVKITACTAVDSSDAGDDLSDGYNEDGVVDSHPHFST
jgi:hypothetical protein